MNVLVVFQGTIAVTDTPQILPTNQVLNGITLTALAGNTGTIAASDDPTVTQLTGYLLEKGKSAYIPLNSGNTNQIYVTGTSGDKFTVIGS